MKLARCDPAASLLAVTGDFLVAREAERRVGSEPVRDVNQVRFEPAPV